MEWCVMRRADPKKRKMNKVSNRSRKPEWLKRFDNFCRTQRRHKKKRRENEVCLDSEYVTLIDNGRKVHLEDLNKLAPEKREKKAKQETCGNK